MKTHTKISLLILIILGGTMTVYAGRMNGIWATRDNRIQVEIRNYDRGIKLKKGNNPWSDYSRKGNRYQSNYGSFCREIDDNSLEWYDRSSRNRYTLYRQNQARPGSNGNRYNDRYDDRYNDRYDDNNDRRYDEPYFGNNLEGRWYNESTGQHISVKAKRDGLRIKFRRERWVTFRPQRNGVFVDGHGNRWIAYRNRMEFESFNRDLNMQFYKGEYRGRRNDCYFGF